MNSSQSDHRTALVLEGGAMRGIFSAGVLDAFIAADFNPFDLCIGVSAGATNGAAYLGRQYQRNYRVYTDFCTRADFISLKKFLRGGHLMDLDWLWNMTIKEIRLDLKTIFSSGTHFVIGVTSVTTGKPLYLEPDESNCEHYLKISSSFPGSYRTMHTVDGEPAVDGGIADSIPTVQACRRGAKRILVVRTQPEGFIRKTSLGTRVHAWTLRRYPALRAALLSRAARYQQDTAFIRNPPGNVKCIEVAPQKPLAVSRFTKDRSLLEMDYRHGVEQGKKAMERWGSING